MNKTVTKYQEGQKQCVDMIADIASGIAPFGIFAFATSTGIVASPFTGGATLGRVALGFGIAGAVGAGVKIGIKGIDSFVGGRKYDSFGYDLATGGINGMFAPITAGVGGAAGKAVAGKIGVTALREGGEIVVKKTLKGTAKAALTRTLLTTNIKYVGGTIAARGLALGTDMAVNGSITGAIDSSTRYLAGDEKNKSFKGFAKEVGTGIIGGLIMAPIIGGGMRLAGNWIGKLTGKLQTQLATNYSQATINGIMKELNVIADSEKSNLIKATIQRIETSNAINDVCGSSISNLTNIKDLFWGIIKSFKINPKETWQTIKPIIYWAYKNNNLAMLTFFQIIMKIQ